MGESKYVVFALGSEQYGLPIESVERILVAQATTRIPRSPKAMLGLFDLRGTTVPAFDLGLRLANESSKGLNDIVVNEDDFRYALRVDQVIGIVMLSEADQDEAPPMFQNSDDAFIAGIGKSGERLIVLLEPSAVLPDRLRVSAEKALAA
jgi:purine-binding chemotaxis protein CheW